MTHMLRFHDGATRPGVADGRTVPAAATTTMRRNDQPPVRHRSRRGRRRCRRRHRRVLGRDPEVDTATGSTTPARARTTARPFVAGDPLTALIGRSRPLRNRQRPTDSPDGRSHPMRTASPRPVSDRRRRSTGHAVKRRQRARRRPRRTDWPATTGRRRRTSATNRTANPAPSRVTTISTRTSTTFESQPESTSTDVPLSPSARCSQPVGLVPSIRCSPGSGRSSWSAYCSCRRPRSPCGDAVPLCRHGAGCRPRRRCGRCDRATSRRQRPLGSTVVTATDRRPGTGNLVIVTTTAAVATRRRPRLRRRERRRAAADVAQAVTEATLPEVAAAAVEEPARVEPMCSLTYNAGPGDSWYRIADAPGVTPRHCRCQPAPGSTLRSSLATRSACRPGRRCRRSRVTTRRTGDHRGTTTTDDPVKPRHEPTTLPRAGLDRPGPAADPRHLARRARGEGAADRLAREQLQGQRLQRSLLLRRVPAQLGVTQELARRLRHHLLKRPLRRPQEHHRRLRALYQRSGGWGPWGG